MRIRPAKADASTPNLGSFALVTYLPDPLGSFLTELRRFLPGHNCPEAHLTLLPPRPLQAPMEIISREVRQVLAPVQPFELELGRIQVFPQTNMLYLTVEAGWRRLLSLHSCLNTGALFAEENFEYIPHVTLSGVLEPADLAGAQETAEKVWRRSTFPQRFVVNEVIMLWQADNWSDGDWSRISSYLLLDKRQIDAEPARPESAA